MKIIVVGAGALGGWTALMLQRDGHEVCLIDGHGPGNARASSGDETRVIRTVYKDEIYTRLTLQSMQLWEENEALLGEKIFYRTGVINFIGRDETRWQQAQSHLNKWQIDYEILDNAELKLRYPLFSVKGIQYSVLENGGGYLRARAGCEAIVRQLVKEGGQYLSRFVKPIQKLPSSLGGIELTDGSVVEADQFVFATGPWLPYSLPGVLEGVICPTKQDLFYFGIPPAWQQNTSLPVWCDFATLEEDIMYYGIPASDLSSGGFGFKVAADVAGPSFDPEWGERVIDADQLHNARRFMEQRFPFMKGAPLLQTRVCQYESTADAHLLADKVPDTHNVWVVGGGSGHGYKLGAGIGQYITQRIKGVISTEPLLSFDRFKQDLDKDTRR